MNSKEFQLFITGTSCAYSDCVYPATGVNNNARNDASGHSIATEEKRALISLHEVNYTNARKKVWKWRIKKAKRLKRDKIEYEKRLDHLNMRRRKIQEYYSYVHPSGDVIFAEWYPPPDPIWVPKLLADEKRALILNLNGTLVTIVNTRFGDKPPAYAEDLVKHTFNHYWEIYCRKDSQRFLDWCIKFFNVYIWSTEKEPKVEGILDCVFTSQRPLLAGVFSQQHCTRAPWLMHDEPVFFKDLKAFWREYPQFTPANTLIIDDSRYKVYQNEEGTWLLVPKLKDHTEKQRQFFLVDTLADWLFLWLQSEDRQAYTVDNSFETSNDVFSDAVIDRIAREQRTEAEAQWREANLQRQREADLEAESLENKRLEREAEEREILDRLRREEEAEAQKKEEPIVHYKRPRRRKYIDSSLMDEL